MAGHLDLLLCCLLPDTASFMIMTLPVQAVSQVDGKDLDPSNTVGKKFQTLKESPPDVGTTHRATVQSVKSYGAFVRLEGYKSNGLVHSSQVSLVQSMAPASL